MNLTSLTSRPALSKIIISANEQDTNQMLDEILAISKLDEPVPASSRDEFLSNWFSQSRYMGLDENQHRMYSLTRGEHFLFGTVALTGLAFLGSVLSWLLG